MEETWKLLLQTQWFFSGKLGSVPALDEAAEPQEAPLFVWRSTCVKASYSEGLYATKVTCCWREKKENNVVVEVVISYVVFSAFGSKYHRITEPDIA